MQDYLFQVRMRYEDGSEWVIGMRIPETNETQAIVAAKQLVTSAISRGKYSKPDVPMSSWVCLLAEDPVEPTPVP